VKLAALLALGACTGGGSDGRIAVTLTHRPTTSTVPFIAAYRDGTGPWQEAPPPNGDTYSFTVSSPVWGFAWACSPGNQRWVTTYEYAVSDRTSVNDVLPGGCRDAQPVVHLSGTISNSAAGDSYEVSWGGGIFSATGSMFAIDVVPGTHDLIVAQHAASGTADVPSSMLVQRGLVIAGDTVQTVDFSAAAPAQTAAITGVPSGSFLVFTAVDTAGGTDATLAVYSAPPTSGDYLAVGLPAAQAQAGDVYEQSVGDGNIGTSMYVSAPTAEVFDAPPPMTGAVTTLSTSTPYRILTSTWPAYPETIGYTWIAGANISGTVYQWIANISPGAAGAAPSYTMPDLSALPGWDASAEIPSGDVEIVVSAYRSTVGTNDLPFQRWAPVGTKRTNAHQYVVMTLQ
jgi:hypothetical protein